MLSKRLQKVLDYINKDDSLADIGCDHGYLAMAAITKGVKTVQLVDNKIGPLNVAKNNLAPYEKLANVTYTLADGLSKLDSKINVVAICGMGGDLIATIIRNNIDVAKTLSHLVLEANSKVDILRSFLDENNFEIIDETIIFDKNRYYEIIKTSYANKTIKLTEDEIMFGPINLKYRTDAFLNYLEDKIKKLDEIINKNASGDISQLKKKKERLMEILYETKRTN